MTKTKGLIAAVLAYTSWGPLAPIGALLLQTTGPFTLNVIRTAGALLLFAIVYGPKVLVRATRLILTDPRVWLLGVFGLALTFGAYLMSILYLSPTVAALTIYLSPILVAWIAHARMGEATSPLFFSTIALTIIGGAMAVLEPSHGGHATHRLEVGLLLGLIGVAGWTFYTLYLKHLGKTHPDTELTLSAFLTSGVAFLVVAIPVEHLHFTVSTTTLVRLGIYILFPSFISFQLYSYAVRHAGATLTAILLGVELAATAVFSFFLTGEQFGFEKTFGILVVLVAVTAFLIGEGTRPEPRDATPAT